MKARQAAALLLCLITLLSLIGTGCEEKADTGTGKSFTWHLASEPKTLDPQIATGENAAIVIGALYEGLARLDENGDAVPGAAESWENSADYKTYTFYLREDALWSDGETPVTAEDFVYAFRRALDPATGSTSCSPMLCLKNAAEVQSGALAPEELGVRAEGEYTLVVELAYPVRNFPVLTALPVFMPCNQEFFEGTAGRYGLDRSCILSNGPFIIDGVYGWDAGRHINLAASSRYWGTVAPASVKLPIGSAELDIEDEVIAVSNGDVDAIALTESQASRAESRGCTITSFEDTVWGFCFNLTSDASPERQNEEVRTAFLCAVDWAALRASLPQGEAAEGVIPPAVSIEGENYREKAADVAIPAQLEDAAALMQEGLAEVGAESPPALTILCPDDPELTALVNEILVVWNNTFGQYFNMAPLSESELASRLAAGSFSAAVCPFTPESDDPAAVLSLFSTGDSGNVSGFSDASYDALVEQVRHTSGTEKLTACESAEQMLVDRAVFLPISFGSHYFASAPGVSGIIFRPYGGGVDFIGALKK